jgi:hypothetical protein
MTAVSRRNDVYLHKAVSKNYQIIETRNLLAVLTVNWLFDPLFSGIPRELVQKIYDDHEGLLIRPEHAPGVSPKKIIYISVDDPEETAHLLHVISFMNALPDLSFTIYCPAEQQDRLKTFVNDHISFIIKKNKPRPGTVLPFDGVMTFGSGALHFLRQGIPVLIAGPYGWGGMVGPDNFPHLVKGGFMGRPGAVYGEGIPVSMVKEEWSSLQKIPDLPEVLEDVKKLAEGIGSIALSEADELVRQAKQLRKSLYDHEARWRLRPKMASNIELVSSGGLIYCRRQRVNDTVAVINAQRMNFLGKIDGEKDCAALYDCSGMTRSGFWDQLYILWDKKIIVF